MKHFTNFILIISLTLLFISACTESNQQTRKTSPQGGILKQERLEEEQVEKFLGLEADKLDCLSLKCLEEVELAFATLENPKLSIGQKFLSHGSTIEVIENEAEARIEYKSYNKLADDIFKIAKLRMWSQNTINYEYQSLPKGGLIWIHVSGNTIDSANTKWWEYIVLSVNGKEFLRKRGSNSIPNITTSKRTSTTEWWNIDALPLTSDNSLFPPLHSQQFKVFVIDILRGKRSGFIVYPNLGKN